MYGEDNAQLLVQTWTDRMNAFMDMWSAQTEERLVYSTEQVASVKNSPEFEGARLLSIGAVRARFDAVGALAPK